MACLKLNVLLMMVFPGIQVLCEICWDTKSFSFISDILHPKTSGGFLLSTTASRADCAARCERKSKCTSFYHNAFDDECFLASDYHVIVPDTTYTDNAQNRFDRYKKPGPANTCRDVQTCGGISIDGEYWLSLLTLQGEKVKVFCSDMNTASPKEYISLSSPNNVHYPPECNLNCHGDKTSGCPGSGGGHTDYTKIKVDLTTMVVDRKDRAFSSGTGEQFDYGIGKDCYNTIWGMPSDPTLPCGPRGTFVIDSTGTGLKFNNQTTWTASGYKAIAIITKSPDGKRVDGICGGWCGGCNPDEIKLEFNPNEVIPEGSATAVLCP